MRGREGGKSKVIGPILSHKRAATALINNNATVAEEEEEEE